MNLVVSEGNSGSKQSADKVPEASESRLPLCVVSLGHVRIQFCAYGHKQTKRDHGRWGVNYPCRSYDYRVQIRVGDVAGANSL